MWHDVPTVLADAATSQAHTEVLVTIIGSGSTLVIAVLTLVGQAVVPRWMTQRASAAHTAATQIAKLQERIEQLEARADLVRGWASWNHLDLSRIVTGTESIEHVSIHDQ